MSLELFIHLYRTAIELFFYKFTHPDHLLCNLEMYKVNTCTNVLKIAETQHDLLSIVHVLMTLCTLMF